MDEIENKSRKAAQEILDANARAKARVTEVDGGDTDSKAAADSKDTSQPKLPKRTRPRSGRSMATDTATKKLETVRLAMESLS